MMQKPTSRLTPLRRGHIAVREDAQVEDRIADAALRNQKHHEHHGGARRPNTADSAAAAVDPSRSASGEPRPTLSRTSATAKKRDANPVDAALRCPDAGNPASPHHVTTNDHDDDRKVDPEQVGPGHELHHDPAVQMAEHPARRVDRADDPERERPLLGRKQIGDERHAHRHHRACTERLDDAADNQRIERGEAGSGRSLEQLA